MNIELIKEVSQRLNIKEEQTESVLKLLKEGSTIPFIARYRKEVTSGLNEEQIRSISEVYQYEENLLKRKLDVIRLIEEKDLMTDDLKQKIMNAKKQVEVEDLYLPFKEKKKTKATEAIKNGLEGLAKIIMSFPTNINIEEVTQKYLNDSVKTQEEAIEGAKYIIAEWISDNASYRKIVRNYIYNQGIIKSKIKKDALDEEKIFEIYYSYEEKVQFIKPHRILALNRGEKLNILSVSISLEEEKLIELLKTKIIKNSSAVSILVEEAINDSYKRLIFPSIEREIRSELTQRASDVSIENFKQNLEHLLLTPPIKEKIVLALDPAFRTGCKLAVLDKSGKVLEISVIYPHEPVKKYDEAKNIVKALIQKYNVDIIAIGNGTASRESEKFITEVIKEINNGVEYIMVSEAGASVYSASKLGIEEFPDLTVEKRSAVSIGRRLQDAMSELVKIEPESIGVGMYQHDINPKKLHESLSFVVEKCVNSVGVNLNTASSSILKYISGLNKKNIEKIIEFREKIGKINTRKSLLKEKILTPKVYEQAIGFLRITDGEEILDKTSIHPESYGIVQELLKKIDSSLLMIGSEELKQKLKNIDINILSKDLKTDKFTLEDILENLIKPNRDPRENFTKPVLRSDILEIEDLKVGDILEGTVRNVVDFGAFIDIGLHNDALVHISEISNNFIKHPSEVLTTGDIVKCYVKEIFKDKKKVSLSLKESVNK